MKGPFTTTERVNVALIPTGGELWAAGGWRLAAAAEARKLLPPNE
jgi:hypothetical protein